MLLGPSRYEYIEERSYGNVFNQGEYQQEAKLTFKIYYETIGRLATEFKIPRWYVEEILRTCFSSCKVYKDASITGYTVFSADLLLQLSYNDLKKAVGRWAKRMEEFCYLAQELPGFLDAGHY